MEIKYCALNVKPKSFKEISRYGFDHFRKARYMRQDLIFFKIILERN